LIGTANFNGTGQFKLALVNATGTQTYWSNDGSSTTGSQPTQAVTLTVANGLYSVLLGDTALANMTAIPNAVFANSDVRLRVWFNGGAGFQQLTPDQRIVSVGYALMAGAAAAWVLYLFTMKPLQTAYPNLAITTWQMIFGAISFAPFAWAEHAQWQWPSVVGWGNLIFQGVICSAVSYLLYNYALNKLGMRTASLAVNVIPVITAVAALAFEVHDAHVRDVEHTGVAPHRVVLLDLRAVVDRHVPAAEIHHARAGRDMQVIERCPSSHRSSRSDSRPKKRRRTHRSAAPLS
jgi:hypothetical protein